MTNVPAVPKNPDMILRIIGGLSKGAAYKIVASQIIIGRDPSADICLKDARSSRKHAVVEKMGTSVVVKDLGSQNGILVNGCPCQMAQLSEIQTFNLSWVHPSKPTPPAL